MKRARGAFRREEDGAPPTTFRTMAPSSNIEDETDGLHRSEAQAPFAEASMEPLAPFARGRVVRQDGHMITLEITAPDGGMDWDPAVPIELHHADGRVERVRAYAAGSTRAGTVGAGLAVLITISLSDKGLRALLALHLLRADGSVQIIAL